MKAEYWLTAAFLKRNEKAREMPHYSAFDSIAQTAMAKYLRGRAGDGETAEVAD